MNLDQALDYARAVGLSDRQIAVVVRQEADRVRFKVDTGQVALMHPDLGVEVEVHPDAVAQHELAGWLPVVNRTDETPEEKPAGRTPRKAS